MPPTSRTRRLPAPAAPTDHESPFDARIDQHAPAGDVLPALAALLIELAKQDPGLANGERQQNGDPLAAKSRKRRKGAPPNQKLE